MKTFLLLCVLLAGALVGPVRAAYPLVLLDSFDNNTYDGALHGKPLESASSGSYNWVAQGPLGGGYYQSGGTILSGAAGNSAGAPITRMAWINQGVGANETATLSLDVKPAAWTSIGFYTNPGLEYDSAEWNVGQLALRLYDTGGWEFLGPHYGFNSNTALGSGAVGSAPNFVAGGLNQLKLDYDYNSQLATAFINGVQVGSTTISPNGALTAAGFHMYGVTSDDYVDNFNLTIAPEPSRCALLLGGVAGMLLRRRRRA
jgi:hypothetical protein